MLRMEVNNSFSYTYNLFLDGCLYKYQISAKVFKPKQRSLVIERIFNYKLVSVPSIVFILPFASYSNSTTFKLRNQVFPPEGTLS